MDKIAIFGVGLIGGSFALALKNAKAVKHVSGFGRSRQNLAQALERGVIDSAPDDIAAVHDAELILLATPVGQMGAVLKAVVPHLAAGAVVTDAGSTKQDVIALAKKRLGKNFPRFVPAHPVAGGERTGVAAAGADLFRNRRVVLTPVAETDKRALKLVTEAWTACGAAAGKMGAREHDEMFAAVSHLPHLLAYALVHLIANDTRAETLFQYAAGGFRDFTRIASSSPEMWRDICLANRTALIAELRKYQGVLGGVEALLKRDKGAELENFFSGAREARNRWLKKHNQ